MQIIGSINFATAYPIAPEDRLTADLPPRY
jgi:hypothetical protein